MADADRDSELGDDSPASVRSESSGEQSCESSDEGGGREGDAARPPHAAPPRPPHAGPPRAQIHPHHGLALHHSPLNNHQHQRNSPRPPELKIRDDFDSLKTSLHPHLSSLASLAQGTPLSAGGVFGLAGGGGGGGASPFPYPPSAFLAPAPPPHPAPPVGSASSSSSEGSAAGWSFEEQYKQVRQLYEISDEPQRKEFLDDLFSFMQKRGTPINRLPIMAKSVLDLFELYNLVIARGGLVEVINKKLWQEIIKGLRLPSSITSAAFTLRTQYMKYLYDYECDKKNLSTRSELDAAIEGNKREGRRASGQYDAQAALAMPGLGRGVPVSLSQLGQLGPHVPLSSLARLPPLPPHAPHAPHAPPLSHHDIEYRVREYVKLLHQQKDTLRNGLPLSGASSPPEGAGGGAGAGAGLVPRDALTPFDVSRLTLWSLYNNNHIPHLELEPQRYINHMMCSSREALNLSESPNSTASGGKREGCRSPPPPAKRRAPSPSPHASPAPSPPHTVPPRTPHAPHAPTPPHPALNGGGEGGALLTNGVNGAAFKITTRGDAASGDQQLVVSIELNGVVYEGVLFPSQGEHHRHMVT